MTEATTKQDIGTVEVCVDCYFAHHYGAHSVERAATEQEESYYLHGHNDRSIMGLTFNETDHGLEVTEWFAGESDDRSEGGEPLKHLPEYGHVGHGWRVTGISDFTCSNHFYDQTLTADDMVCGDCGCDLVEDEYVDRWRHVYRFPVAGLVVEVVDVGHEPDPMPAACEHCGQTGWEDGITEFTWTSCDGCDSNLGGSRYRLAIHWEKAP